VTAVGTSVDPDVIEQLFHILNTIFNPSLIKSLDFDNSLYNWHFFTHNVYIYSDTQNVFFFEL